jgi:hypothetical protein
MGSIHGDSCDPEIERALERVLASEDLRMHMRSRGLTAAQRLTWDEAGRQMMEVIRKVSEQ